MILNLFSTFMDYVSLSPKDARITDMYVKLMCN